MSRDHQGVGFLDGQGEPGDALAARIERHIARRACGRVQGLRVDCSEGQIVLEGRCRTYHAKQIVQEAALDLTDGRPGIVNLIVVE